MRRDARGEPEHSTRCGDEAAPGFRQAETRARTRHDHVAGQGQIEPACKGRPPTAAISGLVRTRLTRPPKPPSPSSSLQHLLHLSCRDGFQIQPRGEGRTCAAQDADADGGIRLDPVQGRAQSASKRDIHGIARFGAVQRQRGDAVFNFGQDQISHWRTSRRLPILADPDDRCPVRIRDVRSDCEPAR